MAVTGQLSVAFAATTTGTLDLGVPRAPQATAWNVVFANGTGAGQADVLWSDIRTIAASTTENLDLTGTLLDPFGAVVNFARVRMLLVRADPGNTNNVIVGGAASNAWATWVGAAAHTVTVNPGGIFLVGAPDATGYAVTAGTGDLLKIANSSSGTAVTYTIALLGASI